MKKTLYLFSIVSLLALVLTACSTAAPSPSIASSSSGNSVSVDMKNFTFSPQSLTVKVGTTVTWTNMDSAGHDVKAADGSWGSDTLNNGQSYSHLFDKAGTYPYVCTFHPKMVGTITVTQ